MDLEKARKQIVGHDPSEVGKTRQSGACRHPFLGCGSWVSQGVCSSVNGGVSAGRLTWSSVEGGELGQAGSAT